LPVKFSALLFQFPAASALLPAAQKVDFSVWPVKLQQSLDFRRSNSHKPVTN
jgi:hypothetical protein